MPPIAGASAFILPHDYHYNDSISTKVGLALSVIPEIPDLPYCRYDRSDRRRTSASDLGISCVIKANPCLHCIPGPTLLQESAQQPCPPLRLVAEVELRNYDSFYRSIPSIEEGEIVSARDARACSRVFTYTKGNIVRKEHPV